MNIVAFNLVRTFDKLVSEFNNCRDNSINHSEIRDFEVFIKSQGIDMPEVRRMMNEDSEIDKIDLHIEVKMQKEFSDQDIKRKVEDAIDYIDLECKVKIA